MAYAVVEFQHKYLENGVEVVRKEVDVVASDWLDHEGGRCFWPSGVSSAIASKMAKNLAVVEDQADWDSYEVTVLYKHDDYMTARRKSSMAENLSNVETEPEETDIHPKRKRKRNSRYISDEEDSCEELSSHSRLQSGLAPVPLPPQLPGIRTASPVSIPPRHHSTSRPPPPKSQKTQSTSRPTDSPRCNIRQPVRTPPRAPPPSPRAPPRRTPTPRAAPPRATTPVWQPSAEGGHTPLNAYKFQLKVFEAVEEVRAIAIQNRRLLQKLVDGRAMGIMDDFDILEELLLPVKTEEDLKGLNRTLKAHSSKRKSLLRRLANIGGKDLRSSIYALMPQVLTNRLAEVYSLQGRKSKKNFSEYSLVVSTIFGALRKNFESSSDADIRHVIGDWLKHAKSRKDRPDLEEEEDNADLEETAADPDREEDEANSLQEDEANSLEEDLTE